MLRSRMRKLFNFGEGSKQVNEYERAHHNFPERRLDASLHQQIAAATLDDAARTYAKSARQSGKLTTVTESLPTGRLTMR